MGSHCMGVRNHLYKKSLLLKLLHHGSSGLITVHAGIFAAFVIHGAVII